ncbi:MAG: hypothetical protein WDM76_18060 [Limisphaerales bacterium]
MKIQPLVKVIIATGFLLSLTGCATWSSWVSKKLNGEFHAKPIVSETAINHLENAYTNLTEVEDRLEQSFKTNGVDLAEATRQRDIILNNLLQISDHYYSEFKHSVFIHNAAFNTQFDLASIGLSSAATLVGGPAAQALSATDTGIKAAQGKISDRWLSGRTMPVLVATMDAMRAETLTVIYTKMTNSYDKFGITEGVRLVAKYHQQASLLEAMDHLAAQADESKSKNEANVTKAQMLSK